MLRLPNVRKLLLAGSFAVLFLLCTGVTQADSLFNGSYAVGNWTTTLTNSDGGVNTAGAPTSILLTGGNNGSEASGETLFSISVPTTTTLTFGWTTQPTTAAVPNGTRLVTRSTERSFSSRHPVPLPVSRAVEYRQSISSRANSLVSMSTRQIIYRGQVP